MSLDGILDPGELAIISAVLDDYCRKFGIAADDPEREALAHRALTLVALGIRSPDDLLAALGDRRSQALRPATLPSADTAGPS